MGFFAGKTAGRWRLERALMRLSCVSLINNLSKTVGGARREIAYGGKTVEPGEGDGLRCTRGAPRQLGGHSFAVCADKTQNNDRPLW